MCKGLRPVAFGSVEDGENSVIDLLSEPHWVHKWLGDK